MVKKSKFGVKVGKKSSIVIDWKDNPINYSYEAKKQIISIASDRYGIPKDSIKVNFTSVQYNEKGEEVDISSEVINNIQDPKFQVKLFSDYISENNISDVDFEFIKKVDSEINSKIDYDIYEKYNKYEIEWIEWSNFLSYGNDNFLDLRELNGLILVDGEPKNMSGKSTLTIDLISFLLFGKVQKPYTLSECFNKFTDEKTFKVSGGLKINNSHYVVERIVTRSKRRSGEWGDASQEVKYYEVINGQNEELTENNNDEHSIKTNKIIKESVGNEKDFNMIISASSNDLDSLIDVGSTEKGRLLSKWIGLFPLEEKDRVGKEAFKEFERSLKLKQYNENDLLTENENINEKIKNNENSLNSSKDRITELDSLMAKEQQERDTLLQSKKNIDNDILKLDITTENVKIEKLISDGKQKATDLELKKSEFDNVKGIQFDNDEYKKLHQNDKEYSLRINDIKNEVNSLKTLNKGLLESEYCPTCKRKYDGKDNSELIHVNDDKIKKLIELGVNSKTKLDKNKEAILKMEEEKIQYDKKLKLQNIIEILPIQLENLRNELRESKRLIKEYNENKEYIDLNNKIDISLTNVNSKLNALRIEYNNKIKEVDTIQRNIEDYKKNIDKNIILITQLKEETIKLRNWKLYLEMIGKNGISKMVLKKTLPVINSEIARILDDVCEFDVEVVLTDKNEIVFKIIKDSVVSNLSGASGFERTAAALALRCVLGNISTMPKPNFITLDEILGRVSKDFYDNIKNLYTKIENNYQFILHITHIEEIKDWHKREILISKVNNISSINKCVNI